MALAWVVCAYARPIEHPVINFYLPSVVGSPFGEKCGVSLDGSTGALRLKYYNSQMYNAREFDCYAHYSIPMGAKLVFKMENGENLILVCNECEDIEAGFVDGSNGVYQGYKNISYFPLDDVTIGLLREYGIVKIRGEFKGGIFDGSLKFAENSTPECSDFENAYQNVCADMKNADSENYRQRELQNNILDGF